MSHSGKRKVNSQHCSTNEHETNSKKSCKDKKRVSGIFAVMMSNGRHLAKNMDRFQVESAARACYFCGCTENLHECHSCRSVVCYLRSGCSMLNSSDESMLYCLDCLWVLLCTCFCFTCIPKRGAFLPHERYLWSMWLTPLRSVLRQYVFFHQQILELFPKHAMMNFQKMYDFAKGNSPFTTYGLRIEKKEGNMEKYTPKKKKKKQKVNTGEKVVNTYRYISFSILE